ncbi:unnamed protein product [Ectocarpus sp. 12 AP-2014]
MFHLFNIHPVAIPQPTSAAVGDSFAGNTFQALLSIAYTARCRQTTTPRIHYQALFNIRRGSNMDGVFNDFNVGKNSPNVCVLFYRTLQGLQRSYGGFFPGIYPAYRTFQDEFCGTSDTLQRSSVRSVAVPIPLRKRL